MKTTKRKRSTKAAPASRASDVDTVVAETSAGVVAEGLAGVAAESSAVAPESVSSSEPAVDLTNELSPAAVEALVAEPAAEQVAEAVADAPQSAAEPIAEALQSAAEPIAEAVVDAAAEPVTEQAEAAAAEQVTEVVMEAVAETAVEQVVEAAAEPAVDAVLDPVNANAESASEFVDQTADTIVAEPVELSGVEAAPAVEPIVVLAANCSVKDAAALKTSLCAIAHESTVTLDVTAVERVDTATMQLLCAFVRDRSRRNQSVIWRGESQALQDAVRLLGVAELLGFEANGRESNGVAA